MLNFHSSALVGFTFVGPILIVLSSRSDYFAYIRMLVYASSLHCLLWLSAHCAHCHFHPAGFTFTGSGLRLPPVHFADFEFKPALLACFVYFQLTLLALTFQSILLPSLSGCFPYVQFQLAPRVSSVCMLGKDLACQKSQFLFSSGLVGRALSSPTNDESILRKSFSIVCRHSWWIDLLKWFNLLHCHINFFQRHRDIDLRQTREESMPSFCFRSHSATYDPATCAQSGEFLCR